MNYRVTNTQHLEQKYGFILQWQCDSAASVVVNDGVVWNYLKLPQNCQVEPSFQIKANCHGLTDLRKTLDFQSGMHHWCTVPVSVNLCCPKHLWRPHSLFLSSYHFENQILTTVVVDIGVIMLISANHLHICTYAPIWISKRYPMPLIKCHLCCIKLVSRCQVVCN